MTRCYDDQPGLSITIGAHTAEALIDAALYRVGELLVHQQMTLTNDDERQRLNLEAQALVGEIAAVRALLQDAQADYVDPGPADGVIDWPAAGEAMDAPGAGTLLVDAEHHGVIPDPRPEPSPDRPAPPTRERMGSMSDTPKLPIERAREVMATWNADGTWRERNALNLPGEVDDLADALEALIREHETLLVGLSRQLASAPAQAECWAVVDDSGNVVKVMATSESADGVARELNADREALGGDPIYVVRRLGGSAGR